MSIDELQDGDRLYCETGCLGEIYKTRTTVYVINDGNYGWMELKHIPDNFEIHRKEKRNSPKKVVKISYTVEYDNGLYSTTTFEKGKHKQDVSDIIYLDKLSNENVDDLNKLYDISKRIIK